MELESFLVKGTEGVIPEVGKMLSEVPAEPAEILNLFSPRFFSFFNPALLDSFGKTPAELFGS